MGSHSTRSLGPALAAALAAALLAPAGGTLVLPATPPSGFNTFMSYRPEVLNASSLASVVALFAASPLVTAGGFETFTVDGGWSQTFNESGGYEQVLDAFGRPAPAPDRFPPGAMQAVAAQARALGLGFGLWHIRGVHVRAVAERLPVKGTAYTIDEIVYQGEIAGGKNGSCLWDSEWLAVNASHPGAQAYYDSVVEALVELGASTIKADCFFCAPCYTDEMGLFTSAVKARAEPISLYYSPGGGAMPSDGAWVADETMATFYRTITDLDGADWYDWGGLQQAIFVSGNFTERGLHGANGTWADLDMSPLDASWWLGGEPFPGERRDRGQTLATLYSVGRYPLFSSGVLPLDDLTASYLTNPAALALNRRVEGAAATTVSYAGNCTCVGGAGSCTIPHGPGDHPRDPCVATWAVSLAPAAAAAAAAAAAEAEAEGRGAAAPSPLAGALAAVALFNIGEDAANSTTLFASLGLPPQGSFAVDDIWTGKRVGVYPGSGGFVLEVRPHASFLLSVSAA